MRKIFFSACLLLTISTICILHDPHVDNLPKSSVNNSYSQNHYRNQESRLHPATLFQQQSLQPIARQVQPLEPPLEERKKFSWWWWVIGVIVALAGGMLLYVLIKKNPRKDAQ